MKILILTIIVVLGLTVAISAQSTETLTVKAGQQKSASQSKLKIKFIAVIEDSRCPVGANCVWAGNAKVKFEVISGGGGRKTIEANTTVGSKGDQIDGWEIALVSVTPAPQVNTTLNPKDYVAKLSITRLQH